MNPAALAKLLEKAQAQDERRSLIQDTIFLLIGVLFVFVVNWSSDSVLQSIRDLF